MAENLLTIIRNFRIENESFTISSDDVLDGCIAPGSYKLLRFDFLSYNAGDSDLYVGSPTGNPLFVWSPAHGHPHLRDFNEYDLLNTSDQAVKPGFKQAFCLMDVERTDPNAPSMNIVAPNLQTATQMVTCCKKEQVMSEAKRKIFTGELKAKVALEAIRGVKTMNEIGQEFGVHPTQVGLWKKELQEQAPNLFDAKRGPKPADPSASPERLYSVIGRGKC